MSKRYQCMRRCRLLLALPVIATLLSACGGTGVEVQTQSATASTTSAKSSSASTSTAPSPTDTATRTTGFGDARPAVDVFLALSAAYNKALQSPATASPTTFVRFVAGQAKDAFEQSLADEKAQGKAFRGTPPGHRLVISSNDLTSAVPSVTLNDCVLSSTTDPWTEYLVATGVAVPTPAPATVPPPYGATIKIFKPTSAGWVVTSYTLDGTKTCSR